MCDRLARGAAVQHGRRNLHLLESDPFLAEDFPEVEPRSRRYLHNRAITNKLGAVILYYTTFQDPREAFKVRPEAYRRLGHQTFHIGISIHVQQGCHQVGMQETKSLLLLRLLKRPLI